MATYKEIQDYIKQKNGFTVKTCWIADVKDQCGLNPRVAANKISTSTRQNQCPSNKVNYI
jgi:hypothetical protein